LYRDHREALAIFQQLHDTRGIAETLDLLGMTCYPDGDLIGGTAYYQQAIALFGALEDKPGLTSSLATLTMRGPTYQTDSLVSAASLADVYQDAEHALKIAREICTPSDDATCSWTGHIQGKVHLMNATDILKSGQLTDLQAIDGFTEREFITQAPDDINGFFADTYLRPNFKLAY
jgi:hypothetical protein